MSNKEELGDMVADVVQSISKITTDGWNDEVGSSFDASITQVSEKICDNLSGLIEELSMTMDSINVVCNEIKDVKVGTIL